MPLTHANVLASARTVAATLRLTEADRALNMMPLSHIHGLVAGLLATLESAGSVYCLPTADVRVLPGIFTEDRPTWYSGVPTMHQAIVEAAEQADPVWRHRLRFIRSASSPLPSTLLRRVETVFGVPVVEAYGMTEASHQVASNPLPPRTRKPCSVGTATGTEIRVVDEHGRTRQPGQTGSVLIRGTGVLNGYLDVPAGEGFTDGWFRTGDEGFLDEEGYLYLRSRTEEVINRGGEKIFPHEIDEVLLTHPKVAAAAAFALPHPRLGEDVAAAVVPRAGTTPTDEELRSHVSASVASFKVPRLIMLVPELPKGPTGKVRRIDLAAAAAARPAGDAAAPRQGIPPALADIWTAALGAGSLRPDGDFFLEGGDSLLSLRLTQDINAAFGTALEPSSLFRSGTSLTDVAQALADEQRSTAEPLRPIERSGRLPMAPAQRGMWYEERLGTSALNTVLALEIDGPLRVDVLRASVNGLVARHESLRTRYPAERGVPYAVVDRPGPIDVPIVTTGPAGARDAIADLARRPFAADSEWPIRMTLVRSAPDSHTLVIVINHLASDAWSRAVVRRDLLAGYRELCGGRAADLPTLAVQAADIADWQTRRLRHRRAAQLAYWEEVFADLPAPLSFTGPAPARRRTGSVARTRAALEIADDAAFAERCRGVGLTEFEVLLAAVLHGLAEFAANRDVVVGVPVCVRNRPELIDQVGYYVRMVPVRARVDGDLSVESPVQISRRYRAAQRQADVPLSDIVGRVDRRPPAERTPLFDVVVKRDLDPRLPVEPAALDTRVIDVANASAQYALLVDLTAAVDPRRHISVDYDKDRVPAETVSELVTGVTSAVRDLAAAGWRS